MVKQKSTKGNNEKGLDPVFTMDKFIGEGVMFKCKLFGFVKVPRPRGDDICADAIAGLKQQAKQLNKERKIHKQRIFLNISLKGIRIIDQQSRKLEHAHLVHKISYISHDKDDKRTFGYIVSLPEGHNLFAFKAEKNAGLITSDLKELFHVVYLKYKQEREKGNQGEQSDVVESIKNDKVEQGEEALEQEKHEDPYAVPMKFQLVEKTTDSEYAVPSSRPATDADNFQSETRDDPEDDGDNLLDLADVNQELELMQNDMKRSDTKQLLAELGEFNLDDNPPRQPESQNIFSDDPFFGSSGFSENFSSGMQSATSNPDMNSAKDPFSPDSQEFLPQASNLSKSRSLEFGGFDNNDAFSSAFDNPKPASTQPFLSDVGDHFSTASAPQPNFGASNTGWSNSFGGGGGGQLQTLSPTVNENSLFSSNDQVPAPDLVPEKLSEPKAGTGDPFAALSGNISEIRGTLPSGGNVQQFQKKAKPSQASPTDPPRVISPGPSLPIPQGQPGLPQQQYQNGQYGGFSQTNPFGQPSMQANMGYNQRFSPPPIPSRPDLPQIPMRQDLMPGVGGFQAMSSIEQQQALPIQKPYSQPMQPAFQTQGNNGFGSATDPFANLGGAFSTSDSSTAQEPLYAVVDKTKKNKQNTDVFGMFDNTTTGFNGGSSHSSANTNSNQDLFGFGF
ncbi:disabled homolog 2-like isoform X2 [Rhopilema esculentum]|uniref:disabled homolog 2-like isoform X2 n=1 Tax=Rhopilema esculentum TaxID=499914 RepID=UPI0031CE24F8